MKESILKIILKGKRMAKNREFLIALLILLVGFGSFGLGRLSALENNKTPVFIEYEEKENGRLEAAAGLSDTVGDKKFVASKNGTKYHHPWCAGAQRISEENKIWFASKEDAEKAGYTPAANCKGL
ncbi:MAG: hypothetical protein HYT93_00190 [Parcubacteria group bacterium]|nr:hypothetical protein [Parcubacteria group bacterium]